MTSSRSTAVSVGVGRQLKRSTVRLVGAIIHARHKQVAKVKAQKRLNQVTKSCKHVEDALPDVVMP